jgi:uncharacterized Zn finger protein (UPF0148 family)
MGRKFAAPPKLDAVALAEQTASKGGRPPTLDAALVALASSGALIARACKVCGAETANKSGLCATHQRQVMTVKEEREIARERIERNAARYAEIHVAGSEIAAAKGDTRPAEWGLLHSRAVESVKGESGATGVVVQIGVVLPGCGTPSGTPTVAVRSLPGSPVIEGERV